MSLKNIDSLKNNISSSINNFIFNKKNKKSDLFLEKKYFGFDKKVVKKNLYKFINKIYIKNYTPYPY